MFCFGKSSVFVARVSDQYIFGCFNNFAYLVLQFQRLSIPSKAVHRNNSDYLEREEFPLRDFWATANGSESKEGVSKARAHLK